MKAGEIAVNTGRFVVKAVVGKPTKAVCGAVWCVLAATAAAIGGAAIAVTGVVVGSKMSKK